MSVVAPERMSARPRPATGPAHVTIRGLTKTFGGAPLYAGFDLDVPRGAVMSVFGPNGCGKSTLINMIAGIAAPDAGRILFGGKTLRETRIGYVFQNYREALFPWERAIDNVAYPLKLMGVARPERERRIERLARSFDLSFDLARYPYELSGGQQQTVSIMRALVVEPEVLFLDEPFSALDYEMTLSMRDLLGRVLHEMGVTTLLVSHDLEEAVYLADRVLLLTRRPTRIAAVLDVPIGRPRSPDMMADPGFVATKAEALQIFRREIRAR